MSINKILISVKSFNSEKQQDIISSNSNYITKLFQNNIKEDKIFEDALKSYYVDYYLSRIQHGGYSNFIKDFSHKPKILYYIYAGLKALKTKHHSALFEKIFFQDNHYLEKNTLDNEFRNIQKNEDLLYFNHRWLMHHPALIILECKDIEVKIKEHIEQHKDEKRHVKIIKELCHGINEEFIGITAGDINNIYNKSWYFKTTQNNYYMLEKNNIVTMYNGFTKEEVRKGRLISKKSKPLTISSFISSLLA